MRIDKERFQGKLPGVIGPYKGAAQDHVDCGLITRTNVEGTWLCGIYWEGTSHVTDHHPADCLHTIVNVGNIPPHSQRAIRGKIYWFKGSKDDLLKRWRRDYPKSREGQAQNQAEAVVAGCATVADSPYAEIEIKEVFSELMARGAYDRVYSGQIKSKTGLADFSRKYSLDLNVENIDFEKKMLIFGITDDISTRAFRFLKQKQLSLFCLDYYDTGIRYKLRIAGDGKRYSYAEVFLLDRIEGIQHVAVKNLVRSGLSKVYE
jgi:hypothetical protein